MSMPVLPPTAASTMPSRVVGTWTTGTPRSHEAAAKPARSVVAPPPTPTIASPRVMPSRAKRDQSPASTSTRLAASPSGTGSACAAYPARSSTPHTGRAISGSPSACTTATVVTLPPRNPGSSPSTPVPTTTSYGPSPPTRIRPTLTAHPARPSARSTGLPAQCSPDLRRRERFDDLFDDVAGVAVVGGDGDRREALVDGRTLGHQLAQPAARVEHKQRPGRRQADPLDRVRQPDAQVDHRVPGQQPLGVGSEDGAAAEGQHPVVLGQCQPDRRALQLAKARLAIVDEDLADRLARGRLDVGVGVAEVRPEPVGEGAADRRLPRAGRPDQYRLGSRHLITSAERYPCRLRAVSSTESPPNLASAASASTSATMASATTPAAGTAVTSLRWLIALAGSPVRTSTVSRARGTVEIGFIAARTRTGSPVVMPPSMPPARWLRRRMPPPGPRSISSCAMEPRVRAVVKPSPTSTPLIAWMPISAAASRESSRRSQWTWLPRPGGTPYASTSTTPPSVSPALLSSSMCATIFALASTSKQRTGSASIRARSAGAGNA